MRVCRRIHGPDDVPVTANPEGRGGIGRSRKTTVAVHQPDFLPYLGLFRKMKDCDIFILYDTAQYSKNGFHNRNRIKTPRGPVWITVPVGAPGFRPIHSVRIDNSRDWGRRLWRTLEVNYARAEHFSACSPELGEILERRNWRMLAELNVELLVWIRSQLGLAPKLVRASELRPPVSDNPTEKLVHLVREVGGDRYLSGPGGREYLEPGKFKDLELTVISPAEVTYPQLWGPFVGDLSIVDVLFNCGARRTRELLERRPGPPRPSTPR